MQANCERIGLACECSAASGMQDSCLISLSRQAHGASTGPYTLQACMLCYLVRCKA